MSGDPPSVPPLGPDRISQLPDASGFSQPMLDATESHGVSQSPSRSHSFQSFGDYSQFLRSAVADEESLQMGESLQGMAVQIEAIVSLLQQTEPKLDGLAIALFNLVGDLRAHRTQLLALGEDWHRFYEFDAHFASLNHFRILVTQWALEAAPPRHALPKLAEFDLAAWRLLGAGSLLLDVYEQSRNELLPPDEVAVVQSVWGRWSAWWTRRQTRRQAERQTGSRGRRETD